MMRRLLKSCSLNIKTLISFWYVSGYQNLNPEFLQVIDESPVVQDTNNILLSGIVKASCVNGRQIGIPADL